MRGNTEQARQRVVPGEILSQPDGSPVLVVMHGRAMRILLCWLTNRPLARIDHFGHSNLCLYKLRYDSDTRLFDIEPGNDTAHLLPLVMVR